MNILINNKLAKLISLFRYQHSLSSDFGTRSTHTDTASYDLLASDLEYKTPNLLSKNGFTARERGKSVML